MKALKFNIRGKTAFFKKPDVNSYYYFTYSCIHKIALLGIVGATLGLEGYIQQGKKNYPEFYEKLNNLEIAIIPKNEGGYINKKIQTFNNSVGYASKEQGGNLIVKEQWLENPNWDIYIKLKDDDISKEIENRFIERRFIYIPYLGKNDHISTITDISLVELTEINECSKVMSLVSKDDFEISKKQEDDWDDEDKILWKYEEKLPVMLEEKTNQYITKSFMATNMNLQKITDVKLYKENENDRVLFFF